MLLPVDTNLVTTQKLPQHEALSMRLKKLGLCLNIVGVKEEVIAYLMRNFKRRVNNDLDEGEYLSFFLSFFQESVII